MRVKPARGQHGERRHRGFGALGFGGLPHAQTIENTLGTVIKLTFALGRVAD